MTGRRTRQEINEDVIAMLKRDGPHTITQIRDYCVLRYRLTQEVLAYLIKNEDITTFWAKRDTGHYCAHYTISSGGE